jgi:hypothetical protein
MSIKFSRSFVEKSKVILLKSPIIFCGGWVWLFWFFCVGFVLGKTKCAKDVGSKFFSLRWAFLFFSV